MTTFFIVLAALVYVAVGFCAYFFYWKKSENTMFEKIWFSSLWLLCVPLALIHWIHNGKNTKW